jgi:hypothetical protein
MESSIIFEGPGPFHLPVAQRATADGHTNNGVTLTLYCQVPAHNAEQAAIRSKEPEPICVQMASSVARDLAAALLRAAEAGDVRRRR